MVSASSNAVVQSSYSGHSRSSSCPSQTATERCHSRKSAISRYRRAANARCKCGRLRWDARVAIDDCAQFVRAAARGRVVVACHARDERLRTSCGGSAEPASWPRRCTGLQTGAGPAGSTFDSVGMVSRSETPSHRPCSFAPRIEGTCEWSGRLGLTHASGLRPREPRASDCHWPRIRSPLDDAEHRSA